MTLDNFLEIGSIWSASNQFLRKLQNSKEIVKEQLLKYDKPYICLSGGKDSVVMAFLIADVIQHDIKDYKGDIILWGHVSDASYPGTIETMEKVSSQTGIKLILDTSPVSAFEVLDDSVVKQFGKQGYFFDAIENCINTYERNLSFIGVRADESRRRMRAVKAHGMTFTSNVPTFCNICYPLAWYKLEDVAALTYMYNTPIHPVYSKVDTRLKYNCTDEGWIRLGYLTAKDLLNQGSAVFIKRNYPEQFEKLAQHYPEIRNYI